jgi:membrane associated rhomboid family serine protease
MSDLGTVALYSGVTAGINAVSNIHKGKDPVPGLIASGALFGLFAIAGSAWRWDVVKALAAVMLLGAILINGVAVFNSIGKFVNSYTIQPRTVITPTPTVNRPPSGGGGGGR